MDVKILERDGKSIRFVLGGAATPITNALRRIIIAEVPSMAIDDVIIVENSSVMYDEVLAHRLGLVPLKTDLDNYVLPEECECHSELGCSRCRVTLTLEAEATDSLRTVYSGELKSENPEVVPVSDGIPIVRLAPGQRIRVEAYARLGRGTTHAKWQPVSACTFKHLPRFQIDRNNCDACAACVDACHRFVVKVADTGRLEVVDPIDCDLCKNCVKACPKIPAAINIAKAEDAFVFYVETTSALPPERVVVEATKILRKKSEEFIEHVSKLEPVASP